MTFTVASDIEEAARQLGKDADHFAGATVLLTGGHGFFGRYLVALFLYLNERVLATPCRLIVVDNHLTTNGAAAEQATGYTFLPRSVIEPLPITEPLDYIIHAAGVASPYYYRKYPLETLEVATTATKLLLRLGIERRLKGFLFFSSSEIYGDPDPAYVPTPESYRGNVSCIGPRACYDESKRLGETLCAIFHELHGVPTHVVRPFNVYGPGLRETDYRVLPNFANRIAGNRPLNIYGHGRQTRTFCYATDAIVGVIKALLYGGPGQVYNIGNPVPEISMVELVKLIERVLGRPLPLQLIDYPDSYPSDEPQRRCPDITKASRQLHYKPSVTLEDGVRRFFAWAAAHYTGQQG
jgi:UDP-glucuronate decarboxylase